MVGLRGYFLSRSLRVHFRLARQTNAALTSRIQETLAGIKIIKAYGAEEAEQQRFETASHEAFDAAFKSRGLLAVFFVSSVSSGQDFEVGEPVIIAAENTDVMNKQQKLEYLRVSEQEE